MIRPIRLTDSLKALCLEDFEKSMTSARLAEGRFVFERSFKWEDELPNVIVRFTMKAYLKMLRLLSDYTSEIGWNGVVYRDEEQENLFHITDIIVCPQTVTGVTVDTDQQRLEKWMRELPVDVFNHMRLQGHSHVNMSVSPSTTDTKNWKEIVGNLVDDGRDEYYIFMIWNKKLEHTVRVYDYTNNRFYDDASVSVQIDEPDFDLDAFMKEVKGLVTSSASSYGKGSSYGGSGYGGSGGYGSGGYGSGNYGSGGYGGASSADKGYYDPDEWGDDDTWEDLPGGRGVKVPGNPQKPSAGGKITALTTKKSAGAEAKKAENNGRSCYSCRYYYSCKKQERLNGMKGCDTFVRWGR